MAMLAEPRRRNKWTLNPRGKLWFNDDTKLAAKLMEKMGWSKGKGLGREEQGVVEPIRLNYKSDTQGMGFKGHDDQWLTHREGFNAILSELNGNEKPVEDEETISGQSLEVRSKTSKARVHYHKFTKGKDLSRYSSNDLACILGKRANASGSGPEQAEAPAEEEEGNSSDGDLEKLHGITTISRGNINEYFAAKMAALQQKTNQTGDEQQEDIKQVRFDEDLNVVNEFSKKERIIEEPKKKKKRKNQDNGEAVILETVVDEETPTSEKKKKKKKKDKYAEESVVETEAEPKVEEEEVAPLESEKKKKKKKKVKEEEPVVEEVVEEVKIEKKKKKSKKEKETVEVQEEPVEIKEEKKKKKKDKKEEEGEVREPEMQEEAVATEEVKEEGKKKKKKKNKKETETKKPEKRKNDSDDVSSSKKCKTDMPETNGDVTEKYTQQPNFSYLAGSVRPETIQKAQSNYKIAKFDTFQGSNLFAIAGYGH